METNTQREKAIKWWNNLDYQERDFYSAFGTVKVDEQLIIDSYLSSTKPTETNTNTVEEAAVIHAQKSWGVYFDDMHPDVAIQNTMGEISIKDFHSGALWQKEQDEAKYKELKESHQELLERLEFMTTMTEFKKHYGGGSIDKKNIEVIKKAYNAKKLKSHE